MKQDFATCFELENKVFNSKQGTLSVTEYHGILNGLWTELDQYQSLQMKCDEDSTTLTQFIEKAWIFKFLSDLLCFPGFPFFSSFASSLSSSEFNSSLIGPLPLLGC